MGDDLFVTADSGDVRSDPHISTVHTEREFEERMMKDFGLVRFHCGRRYSVRYRC